MTADARRAVITKQQNNGLTEVFSRVSSRISRLRYFVFDTNP